MSSFFSSGVVGAGGAGAASSRGQSEAAASTPAAGAHGGETAPRLEDELRARRPQPPSLPPLNGGAGALGSPSSGAAAAGLDRGPAGAALAAGFRARHGDDGRAAGSASGSYFPHDGGGFMRASDAIPAPGEGRVPGAVPAGERGAATASLGDARAGEAADGGKDPADDDAALFGPGGDPYQGLAHEQAAVLRLVRAGRSLFFTGPAGAGKSHVLRRAIRMLVWMHTPTEEAAAVGAGPEEPAGDGWGGREGASSSSSTGAHRGGGAGGAFAGDVETDPTVLVAVTASTGIAACNVGGRTLHSWAGLGRGEDPLDSLVAKLAPKRGKAPRHGTAAYRMIHARALVVDEVSMLDGQLLDKLDHLLRAVRRCPRPMGGLQVLLCGDFFQLPPTGLGQDAGVGKKRQQQQKQWGKQERGGGGKGSKGRGAGAKGKGGNPFDRAAGRAGRAPSSSSSSAAAVTLDSFMQRGGVAVGEGPICFAFQAQVWPAIGSTSVVLRRVFRQKDDRFVALLNQLRRGAVEPGTEALLRHRERAPLEGPAGMRPTRLYARNAEVSRENALALLRCAGEERRFECEDVHCSDEGERRQLAQGVSAESKLRLKPGAQVILLKNIDPRLGLANGAQGVVVGFVPALAAVEPLVRSRPAGVGGIGTVIKSVQDARGVLLGMRRAPQEVPLVRFPLAGRAAERLEEAGGAEEGGENGGAGAEAGGSDGAAAGPMSPGRALGAGFPAWVEFPVLPVAFEINSAAATEGRRFPGAGASGFQRQTGPTRKQVPLKLAYALTIHRSQGMTLPMVDVDLQHIFSPGQAYVALSRAVSLPGLRVRNYRKGCIHAHPEAGTFNRQLGRVHALAMRENKRLATAEAEGGEGALLDAAERGGHEQKGASAGRKVEEAEARGTSAASTGEGATSGGAGGAPAVRAPAAFGGAAAADSVPLEDSDPLCLGPEEAMGLGAGAGGEGVGGVESESGGKRVRRGADGRLEVDLTSDSEPELNPWQQKRRRIEEAEAKGHDAGPGAVNGQAGGGPLPPPPLDQVPPEGAFGAGAGSEGGDLEV